MKPAEIMERATKDGLTITVSNDGNIEMIGDEEAVNNWMETIRENKAALLAELEPLQDFHPCKVFTPSIGNAACNVSVTPEVTQPFTNRSRTVDANALPTHSDGKYSVSVTDASTDPVLVEVTIAGQASFTLEIPLKFYDGIALLELLEHHNAQAEAPQETHSVMSGLSNETEGISSKQIRKAA